jgi:hypothetical protein
MPKKGPAVYRPTARTGILTMAGSSPKRLRGKVTSSTHSAVARTVMNRGGSIDANERQGPPRWIRPPPARGKCGGQACGKNSWGGGGKAGKKPSLTPPWGESLPNPQLPAPPIAVEPVSKHPRGSDGAKPSPFGQKIPSREGGTQRVGCVSPSDLDSPEERQPQMKTR